MTTVNKLKRLVLLSVLALALSGCSLYADHGEPHKITWTPSDNAFGYELWCGPESGVYTSNNNIAGGQVTELPLSLVTLTEGINFCAMTAYNFHGSSGYSNEINFYIIGGDLLTKVPEPPTLNIQ